MSRQLAFDLPVRAALGRGDFLVAPANALATATLDDWQGWPQGKMLLTGPEGAGKSHLAHVWAGDTGALVVPAADLAERTLLALCKAPCVVEDAEAVAGLPAGERALFHLHNLLAEARQPLLLTARAAPAHWGLTLPDLLSRMQGTTLVALEPPDDALLSAVLAKHFHDHQLAVTPALIAFLVNRMDRSFASARDLVAALDRQALSEGRAITRALAAKVLSAGGFHEKLGGEGDESA